MRGLKNGQATMSLVTGISRNRSTAAGMAMAAVLAVGCGGPSKPAAAASRSSELLAWHALGSWSGRGNAQTESFNSASGVLRVHWEAKNETAASAGRFRVTAHSAISGRPLQLAVDHAGVGSGVGYVAQDPRLFYLVVDSADLDWSFSVEEAVSGSVSTGK